MRRYRRGLRICGTLDVRVRSIRGGLSAARHELGGVARQGHYVGLACKGYCNQGMLPQSLLAANPVYFQGPSQRSVEYATVEVEQVPRGLGYADMCLISKLWCSEQKYKVALRNGCGEVDRITLHRLRQHGNHLNRQ